MGVQAQAPLSFVGLGLDFEVLKMFVKFTFTRCNKNMNSPA